MELYIYITLRLLSLLIISSKPQDRKDAFKFLQQLSSQDAAVDGHLEALAKKDAAASSSSISSRRSSGGAASSQQRLMAKFLRTCLDFQFWNVTARASCRATYGMDTFSFSPLLPCGIDEFVGVEYVCCPKEKMPAHHALTGGCFCVCVRACLCDCACVCACVRIWVCVKMNTTDCN